MVTKSNMERATRIELAFSTWEAVGSKERPLTKCLVKRHFFRVKSAYVEALTLRWH